MTAPEPDLITIPGKSFCFTGGLADLKRSAAQREVRARGGLTQDVVNGALNFLIVGSKPSPGWKFGSYGRKIAAAMQSRRECGSPLIVSESSFMDALAACAPDNSGDLDAKVAVVTYRFTAEDPPSFAGGSLEEALSAISACGAHVTVRAFPLRAYQELFSRTGDMPHVGHHMVVEVRVVRQFDLGGETDAWREEVDRTLEAVEGVDGSSTCFECQEGSSAYARLLKTVPESLRITGY